MERQRKQRSREKAVVSENAVQTG